MEIKTFEITPEITKEIIEANAKNFADLIKGRERANRLAQDLLGFDGAMLGSKSGYRQGNPGHVVVFNSNVCTDQGKIWFGDLDITERESDLKDLAVTLKTKIYVLYEMDARFENEKTPVLDNAVYTVDANGVTTFHSNAKRDDTGKLVESR